MLARVIFAIFLLLALLGDARIFLFVLNRVVFGSQRQERNPWGWLMYVTVPLLIVFSALTTTWLIIAAAVGMYWIFTRIRALAFPHPPLAGVLDAPQIGRAHV